MPSLLLTSKKKSTLEMEPSLSDAAALMGMLTGDVKILPFTGLVMVMDGAWLSSSMMVTDALAGEPTA